MTYEIYNYIFIGAAIASGVLLTVSVVLFFVLNIPKVIGDLTGSNARKGIENIRKQNEATGDKSYKSSSVNLKRGRVTDKISNSGRVEKPASGAFGVGMGTAKIDGRGSAPKSAPVPAPAEGTMVLGDENSTMVLGDENSTMVLGDTESTMVLGGAAPASEMQTTLLSTPTPAAASETTMLSAQLQAQTYAAPVAAQAVFEVEIEITYVHTNVVIPQEGR